MRRDPSSEVRRRVPARVLALVLLRVLAILASFTWLAFAPPDLERPRLVAWVLTAFLAYGVVLAVLLVRRRGEVLRWNTAVMAVDMVFALVLVSLTGGVRSVFFLAFYLIAALQAYYGGIWQGLGVALAATGLYLAVVWPTLVVAEWPNYALRGGMLLVTAVGLGTLAEVEERERETIRRLNRRLAERERYIEEILESLRDGVVVLDRRRRVTGRNRAMTARFGLGADEAIGRPILDMIPGLAEEGRRLLLDDLFEGRIPGFAIERIPHARPGGGVMVLNVRGSAIRRHEGPVPQVVLLVEDVTGRVALEQAARQAEKLAAVGTLATGLAHEINNPIGIITSRIDLLLEEAERTRLAPPVREDLGILRRHAMRIARITERLLAFARPASEAKVQVDLNAVVRETLSLIAGQAADEGVRLHADLQPSLAPVLGDKSRLAQVLLNLVNNAREAIGGTGEIRIETGRDPDCGGWVRLQVHDTGVGIPDDVQGRIFEPFFTSRPEGTGLGLSISYGIVREHGGTMRVESREGAGATFTVAFPALEVGTAEPAVVAAGGLAGEREAPGGAGG